MTETTTLAALAESYDAFLVDQFGVLLDGEAAYDFAPAALSRLGHTGKPVILLSNSGKRSMANARRLDGFGFDRDSYMLVLSSGEAAHAELAHRVGDTIPAGAPILVLSRDDDLSGIEGLDLTPTDDPEAARMILLAGSRGGEWTLDDYRALLSGPAARGVPCLCTNPDMTMLIPGGRSFGAGRIAQLYEELGGPVELIGKPYPLIYTVAARLLPGIPAGRVLCIGDSPAHDVRGGRAAGHATALVRTGIHEGEPLDDLLAHCAETGDVPDYVIPRFAF